MPGYAVEPADPAPAAFTRRPRAHGLPVQIQIHTTLSPDKPLEVPVNVRVIQPTPAKS